MAEGKGSRSGALGFVVLVLLASLPGFRDGFAVLPVANWMVWAAVLLLVAGALFSSSSSLRLAALFAAAFIVTRAYPPNVRHLETVRSFFGVHKIEVTEDGRFRVLRHGMELHGAQRLTTDDGKPVTGRPGFQPTIIRTRRSPKPSTPCRTRKKARSGSP